MAATWRVAVVCPDNEKAKEFKDAKENFKALYAESGTKMTFEFSLSNEAGANDMVKRAEALSYKATKDKFEDPLDAMEGSADFW